MRLVATVLVFGLLALYAVTLVSGAQLACNLGTVGGKSALATSASANKTCDRRSACYGLTSNNGLKPSDWCPTGSAKWKGACLVSDLDPNVPGAIDKLFPEGKHPDENLINSDIFVQFTAGTDNNMTVTFLQSIAGWTNRMGFATYSFDTGSTSNAQYAIQRTNSNSGAGCLVAGDSWVFGPFAADTMLIFFLDANSNQGARYWSYFGAGISNPTADQNTCGAPGCEHSAWAYLTEFDLTIFGWEDQSLGDADYNDLVFYLTLQGSGFYNEVPTYDNGTILICNNNTIVSWNSFTDVDCQSWGLLETAATTSSCLSYMAIPAGWTWAPDDATSRNIILQSSAQWSYTGSNTCYLLKASPTTGAGYNVSNGVLQSCSATVKYITPRGTAIPPGSVTATTPLCYNTECSARYVLKSISQSVACASVTRCIPNTNLTLAYSPTTFSSGVITIPDTATVWVSTGNGAETVNATMQVTGGDFVNSPNTFYASKIDVVVLTDFYVDTTSSGSGQRSYIDSSWSTVASSFRSLGMDVRFAVVNFVPSSNSQSASYQLTSDYSFSSAAAAFSNSAFHRVSCGASNAATLNRGRNLVAAINQVATSSSLNWRADSYRAVWVHSLCNLPADGATSSGLTLNTIQRNTGILPVIANGNTGTSTFTFSAGAPVSYSIYNSGGNSVWDSPFRTYSYSPQRGAFLFSQYLKTFQVVAAQGATEWLSGIPSQATALSNTGYAAISYQIKWPSSVPADTTTLYYSTTVQIIGRDAISYLIYFNHAPSLAAHSGTLATTASTYTFTMTPSDLDQGNRLNLIIKSVPARGSVSLPGGSALAAGAELPADAFTLVYTPDARASTYTASFVVTVNDGCKRADASVTIQVPYVNRAPTASNIVINLNEDDQYSGYVNLNSFIDDADSGDTVTAIISSGSSTTGNVRVGSIASSSTTYAAGVSIPRTTQLRYVNNLVGGLSGFGSVTLSYRAFDGSLYSSPATITINIWHKNHAPTISASASVVNKIGQIVSFSVSVSDIDYYLANETAKIRVTTPATWGSGVNAYIIESWAGSTGIRYDGTGSTPKDFSAATAYATGTNVTYSGSTVTFTGLSWAAPFIGSTTPVQSVTFQAIDASGATASTPISFSISDNNPPTWVDFPGDVSSPTKVQGEEWTNLYFAASDVDGETQMRAFTFTVVTAPSRGSAYLQASNGAVSATALTKGQTFTLGNQATYLAYNTSGSTPVVDFRVVYKSSTSSFGEDSLVFSVTDSTSLKASPDANALFETTRKPTPPVSANFVITGSEQTMTPFSIPAESTNNVANEVFVVLEELSFVGSFYQGASGTTRWNAGTNSTDSVTGSGASLPGRLIGDLGYFQLPAESAFKSPVGWFTYHVYEPASTLSSVTYNITIRLTHVNHPPTSATQNHRIKKGSLLNVTLPATDVDADDVDSNLKAKIISVTPYNGGPPLYFDQALSTPVTSTTIGNGDELTDRTFWYKSDNLYDNSLPLMVYQFIVVDKEGAASDPYYGYIYVDPAGTLPIVGTNLTTTPQETPVPMNLAADVVTESGQTPTVTITSLPQKGTFTYCRDDGSCTAFTQSTTLPFTWTSTSGRVVYTPRDNDWGTGFTSFTYTLTDPGTKAVGTYTMNIDVIHVNKPPKIYAANFLTTSQSTSGIIINESEWRTFDWYVNDVDDLPSNLTTQVRVSFYTTQGFSLFNCSATTSGWNVSTTDCTFDAAADVPLAVRSDFAKNAIVSVDSFSEVDSACPSLEVQKDVLSGNVSRNCEARFKFAFLPTPLASYTPYVTVTWTAVDGAGAESSTISALIFVKAVNNPPTIWAPAQVVGAAGITNPFLRDSSQSSATFNDPITVADVDSNGLKEQMTFQVVSGTGNYTFPSVANCQQQSNGDYVCTDSINAFNQWLTDVRFNVTAGDRATLRFIINDLGNSGDWKPSPQLTANATTVVVISAAIAAPKGNSSTLAIAVGVAAGAGLLLLGALGFFLRNAVSPPSDDYFSAATAPISAAPQSPLYQAQNTEHMSPLYKGNA